MNVGFIGAGKVGTAIGCYFHSKGIQVAGYYSRSRSPALQAACRTESLVLSSLHGLADKADIIALTVPDDTIAAVAQDLSRIAVRWEKKVVLHTSGVHASDILLPLEEKGAAVCSVHPMLSFGDVENAVMALESTHFTIEGRGIIPEAVQDILKTCGNAWTEITTRDKVLYHAAACTMSNYLVTLLDVGLEMLGSIGFTPEKARELTNPLVRATLENVMKMGAEKALTGPVSRGDTGTLEKHVEKLKVCSEAWLKLYTVLGLRTVELAKRAEKIDETTALKMKGVLENHD